MKRLLSLMLVTAFTYGIEANLDEISKALSSGDVLALARYFDRDVEIAILGEEDVYSKDQAVEKIQAFFQNYRPTAFSQVHKGASKGNASHYCIGNLRTNNSSFRVYIYLKDVGGKFLIQELRFDEE